MGFWGPVCGIAKEARRTRTTLAMEPVGLKMSATRRKDCLLQSYRICLAHADDKQWRLDGTPRERSEVGTPDSICSLLE